MPYTRRRLLKLTSGAALSGAMTRTMERVTAASGSAESAAMKPWVERSRGSGVVLAVKFDDWTYWTDPAKEHFATGRDIVPPEQDRTVKTSGVGSCKFTVP